MYEYLWLHYKPAAAAIICCVYLCMYMNIKRQFKPQSATCAQRKRQIMTTSFFYGDTDEKSINTTLNIYLQLIYEARVVRI